VIVIIPTVVFALLLLLMLVSRGDGGRHQELTRLQRQAQALPGLCAAAGAAIEQRRQAEEALLEAVSIEITHPYPRSRHSSLAERTR
jgi:hypothetical protein